MDFNDINRSLDDSDSGFEIPSNVDDFEGSSLPIEKIRSSMKSEISVQLFIIVIFYSVLFLEDLDKLTFAVYAIFITITCIFTLMYLVKLINFVRNTSNLNLNTRASVFTFIYDLKLTLEVYKTAVIAGSILLPIPITALVMGSSFIGNPENFEKYFLFQGTTTETLITIVCFFLLVGFFFVLTIWWTNSLYGKHIIELEEVLHDLGE